MYCTQCGRDSYPCLLQQSCMATDGEGPHGEPRHQWGIPQGRGRVQPYQGSSEAQEEAMNMLKDG